jgi:RecG-like helicase
VLGLRQSGLPNFRVADIIRDEKILLEARDAAAELTEKDPVGARNCWERERQKIKGPAQDTGGPALN